VLAVAGRLVLHALALLLLEQLLLLLHHGQALILLIVVFLLVDRSPSATSAGISIWLILSYDIRLFLLSLLLTLRFGLLFFELSLSGSLCLLSLSVFFLFLSLPLLFFLLLLLLQVPPFFVLDLVILLCSWSNEVL
jgi:hypothetical protein